MAKQADTTVVMRVSIKTPDLVTKIVKKVAVLTEGDILNKPQALEYVLKKFLDENNSRV